jgi:hypothetical protein
VKVSDGAKFVFCWVARVMWDNYVGASVFPTDFKAKVSVVFHDCEVQEVNLVVVSILNVKSM